MFFLRDSHKTPLAMKILKKKEIIKLSQVDHIKSENWILKEIEHPFIVKLIESFQDTKYVYMIFEFIPGGELFRRLRNEGRFSENVVLFYGSQILLAIRYLHLNDITYRDLKPENLLLDKKGSIKLADFGFAKILKKNKTYTLCGTPEYLAPEIIKGEKKGYGKSVDWWALGILFYEMLVGYPPFYDKKPLGIYKKILTGVIEFPLFLSNVSKDLIRKLLNPDYKYRLGGKKNGEDIMKHAFFDGVSFEDLYNGQIESPWTPEVSDQGDTKFFDNYPDDDEDVESLPDDMDSEYFSDFNK